MNKNKYTYRSAKSIHDLWLHLAKERSVYFVPLGRMMPTAFFKGYIWHEALKKHFDNGSFFFRAERSNSERIRSTIRNFELPV